MVYYIFICLDFYCCLAVAASGRSISNLVETHIVAIKCSDHLVCPPKNRQSSWQQLILLRPYPVGYVVSSCAVSYCNCLSHLLRLIQTDGTGDRNHYELHNQFVIIASTATTSVKKIKNRTHDIKRLN